MDDLGGPVVMRREEGLAPADVAALAAWNAGPVLTLSLPLDPLAPAKARCRLGHLVDRAEALLDDRDDVADPVARRLVRSLRGLPDPGDLGGPRDRGLVVVTGPARQVAVTVPTPVHASARLGDAVDLLPLLPARRVGERYAVLSLTDTDVSYLEGDRFGLHVVAVRDLPFSVGSEAGPGHDERLRRSLRLIDYAVATHLGTTEPVPVVIVGPAELVHRYAATSHYPALIELPTVAGRQPPPTELHRATRAAVESDRRAGILRTLTDTARAGTAGLALDQPDDAAHAAGEGQVATLVVARSWCEPTPGVLRPPSAALAAPVSAAVVGTLRHHGTVWVADDADLGGAGLAARLRY